MSLTHVRTQQMCQEQGMPERKPFMFGYHIEEFEVQRTESIQGVLKSENSQVIGFDGCKPEQGVS